MLDEYIYFILIWNTSGLIKLNPNIRIVNRETMQILVLTHLNDILNNVFIICVVLYMSCSVY